MNSKFLILILFSYFLSFGNVFAEDLNVAFVNSLVYSKNDFFAGEKVRVYGTLQNYSDFDLQGTASFYENEKFIGSFDFFVANKKSTEVWVDWEASQGEHNLSIKIEDLKKLEIGKSPEQVNLEEVVQVSKIKEVVVEVKEEEKKEESKEDKSSVLNILENLKKDFFDTKEDQASTTPATFVTAIKETSDSVIEKSKQIKEDSKVFLEKKKEKIDEEIIKDKTIAEAKKSLEEKETSNLEKEEKEGVNYYTASLIGAVPGFKEMYSYFLALLIFILNSWWILLGTIFIVLWLMVKMLKKRLSLRHF